MLWGFGFAILFSVTHSITGKYLLQFFTSGPMVLNQGDKYLFWMILLPLSSFATFIWDGVFIRTYCLAGNA